MTKRITFSSKSGESERHEGEFAAPAGTGKVPAVVLVQEWWGVNDHIRSLADRLAGDGFLVLAPDLYDGDTTKDPQQAGKMMQELDGARAMSKLAAATNYLQIHARSNGKVGIIGFCMGGAYSLRAAGNIPEISAAVSFYGIPPEGTTDYAKLKTPVQAHAGSKDHWVTPDKLRAIQQQVQSGGGTMEVHIYDADHAFVNDTRPEVYSPDNAKLAWDRATAFLHARLG